MIKETLFHSNTMKRLILAVAFCLVAFPALGSEQIPEQLVGIWATEDAVLQGPYLFEGQALYLDADGTGAIIGGPPPIGFPINATYNSKTGQVDFNVIENGTEAQSGSIDYDPATKSVYFNPETKLKRRFKEFTEETKKGLGLKPVED